MRSSFLGLEMSKRTIQVSQKTLDIATNNMANIMTEGYTRQRIDTHSMYMRSYKNWQSKMSRLSLAGQGVNAFGVAQIRNPYLDKRFRETNSYLAEYEKKVPILEEIQTIIDNFENVGMEAMLARFKDALSKYATNAPDNLELSSIVYNAGFDITKMLNSYARDLDKLLEDNVEELNATIEYVNTIFDRIVSLNKSIVKEYKATEFGNIDMGRGVSPYGPLELLDARNLLLDELSEYGNIKVEDNVDGSINVYMGGVLMVANEKFEHLVMHDYDKFNAAVIIASNGENVNFRSGEIKAFVDLVNGNGPYSSYYQNSDYGIPYYKSAIDAFAESFANLMNNANGAGYDPMRAMFGSADDYYDVDGKLVSRAPITAANIKMTEEWRVDTSMIGMPFRVTTMLDFGNLTVGSTYELNIGIEGYGIRTIAFTANPLEDPPGSGNFTTDVDRNDAVNQINMQLESVFHELKPPVTISREGLLPNKLLEGNLVTVATGIVNGFPTADIHENHYVSNANLDGNHAHILMLALDETVKYGRALDFAGTPFDYVAFLSNRLGQGLMFLDEQIDTMTVTSNNLLDGRDAVSGVSNDEEGINMLIYQKWYNAAARMMTALDECLDRIINGMGRVGL